MKIKLNNYYYIGIFILITLLILYFYINFNFNNKYKNKNQDIIFYNHNDTSKFLQEDKDDYVKKMSKADLYARKCKTYNEYIDKIVTCTMTYSIKEIEKIYRCIIKADHFFNNYIYLDILNCKEIANIKWKFALTYKNGDKEYEEGLPHTRQDIIFLSKYNINNIIAEDENDDELTSLLIHEKTHIYQRLNPLMMKKIIAKMGYRLIDPKLIDNNINELKRSNPDIDNNIYSNNGMEMVFKYKNSTPTRINDITSNNFSIEHPNEKMAYDIQNAYIKQNSKYIKYI